MYSRNSWGGDVEPFILTKFLNPDVDVASPDPIVSVVIFEWEDKDLIGVLPAPDSPVVFNCLQPERSMS
jgi:hypothetical protein